MLFRSDILTVKEQLSKRGELEEVGGPFYITQLSSKVASSAPVSYTHLVIISTWSPRCSICFSCTFLPFTFAPIHLQPSLDGYKRQAKEAVGDENPIGKTRRYDFWGYQTTLLVKGIFADIPLNTSLERRPEAIISFPTIGPVSYTHLCW